MTRCDRCGVRKDQPEDGRCPSCRDAQDTYVLTVECDRCGRMVCWGCALSALTRSEEPLFHDE